MVWRGGGNATRERIPRGSGTNGGEMEAEMACESGEGAVGEGGVGIDEGSDVIAKGREGGQRLDESGEGFVREQSLTGSSQLG